MNIPTSGSISGINKPVPDQSSDHVESLSPTLTRQGRFTFTYNACYQEPDHQLDAVMGAYQRVCSSTDAQYYHRRIKIGESWQKVDCGWLERASFMDLGNDEGKYQVVPTREEKAIVDGRIVEVGVAIRVVEGTTEREVVGLITLIRPQESFPLPVADISTIRVRCQRGEARCTLNVFPK